jgi:DNA polymerase-3 subunit alpha
LSAHPLDNYRAVLERMGVTPAAIVPLKYRAVSSSRFKLAGIVLGKQERTSKNGNKFAFIQLSDQSGAFEITVFSELLAARRDNLEAGQALLIEADAQMNAGGAGGQQGNANAPAGDDMRFIARSIEPLAKATERASQGVRIKLYEASPLAEIQKVLATAPTGRGKVMLSLDLDGDEAEMELPGGWQLTEAFKSSLRRIGNGLEVGEW